MEDFESYRVRNNINYFNAQNAKDDNGNPTGGTYEGKGFNIKWQDGPRRQEGTDELAAPNGAFVEDMIYAAKQRLEFFQDSKFACDENAEAIDHLQKALDALVSRSTERAESGKLGTHEV